MGLLAPTFAVITAAVIVIASVSKSLYLAANPLEELPWVFLGSGAFTAIASVLYVQAMQRFGLEHRFPALLATGAATLIVLRLVFPLAPAKMALVIFIWAPGVGHLAMMQSWNMASTMLPTRQVKRLIPLLAGIATVGAAVGGAGVRGLLSILAAEELLLVAASLFIVALFGIRRVLRALDEALPEADEDAQTSIRAPGAAGSSESEVRRGFRNILHTPLLLRLATFVFLMQAASVLIDYQFSGELKARYDKDEMAAFLGAFYWLSSVVVLFVSFFATSRVVRVLGIGAALSGVALWVAVGSILYIVAHATDVVPAFYIIAAIAFGERIGQYALMRNAVQMLVTPLNTRKAERAKTLIDGVIYRGATMGVSVLLLVTAFGLDQLTAYSPIVVIACIVVVIFGFRIGPHYQRALFEGLRARRLDTGTSTFIKDGMSRRVIEDMERRIRDAADVEQLRQVLTICRELPVPIDSALLEESARHDDATVAQLGLATLVALGRVPSDEVLVHLLRPDNGVDVLRAALNAASGRTEPTIIRALTPLTKHDDMGVSSMAYAEAIKAQTKIEKARGGDMAIAEDLAAAAPALRARAVRATALTGGSFDFAFFGLPRMLKDPDEGVRLQTIEAMGQLRNPTFIDPLIGALADGNLRSAAVDALVAFGTELLPMARSRLADTSLSTVARVTLMLVIERLASRDTLALLMSQTDSAEVAIRDQATLSLWRMAKDREGPKPPSDWLRARARREIDLLATFARIEQHVAGHGPRQAFFRAELDAQRVRTETRAFRLLGMIYSRAALHRAYLHYRSGARRVRSNAIELIDQHVRDADLAPFVALVERIEDANGQLVPHLEEDDVNGAFDVTAVLGDDAPWLSRVWAWTHGAADPEMDVVVLLSDISLFADLSGERLRPVASILERRTFPGAYRIFAEGDEGDALYLVVSGRVEVVKGGVSVATLGPQECFGELAVLDQEVRSATIRTLEPVEALMMSGPSFQDQLDLHPALARGIIRMLSRRIQHTEHAAGRASIDIRTSAPEAVR